LCKARERRFQNAERPGICEGVLCRKPVSTGKRVCRPAEKPKKRDARKADPGNIS